MSSTKRVNQVRVGPFTAFFEPRNIAEEKALREQVLDQFHASLENDAHPDKPVTLTAFMPDGKRLNIHLPSLVDRRRAHPSATERRRLLGFQLAGYLTAMGV